MGERYAYTPEEYAKAYGKGLNSMRRMVLTVFREHPEMTKGEIERYIRENL